MKLLVTGGAGYIGSHVVLCSLQAGHEVEVLDDLSNGSEEALRRVERLTRKPVIFHRGDVRDEGLLRRILSGGGHDAVLHFAGLKSVSDSVAAPLDYFDVNVRGSIALARVMGEAGVFRLVFSSTAAVYGNQDRMPLTESSELSVASSPYGRSKLMVEQILADLQLAEPHWAIAVLRYFNPVGAHESGEIGECPKGVPANLVPFAMQVAAGREPELVIFGDDYPTQDGTGVRDYIHVMDLAQGHLAAVDFLANAPGCHVWNLGTGHGHSVLEVILGIEMITGRTLPRTVAPRRAGDTARSWADPSRAEVDLGWRATRGLDQMLADHWRWQVQNPDGYPRCTE